jgi:hypothetical protein
MRYPVGFCVGQATNPEPHDKEMDYSKIEIATMGIYSY